MGVVWGAWDPELTPDRDQAWWSRTIAAARERILGEGQALAEAVAIPTSSPVYDVGVIDGPDLQS